MSYSCMNNDDGCESGGSVFNAWQCRGCRWHRDPKIRNCGNILDEIAALTPERKAALGLDKIDVTPNV